MSGKAKRKPLIFPHQHHLDHATSERYLSAEQHGKNILNMNLQRQEVRVGQRGEGKSMGIGQRLASLFIRLDDRYAPKVAEITDAKINEMYRAKNVSLQPVISAVYFPEINTSVLASGGGSGGSGSNNIDYLPQHLTSNQTGYWDNQQQLQWQQYQWTTYPQQNYPYPNTAPMQEQKKQEFKPEDYKGKFCAIVTITHHGTEQHGVLFVKKCGHWKLCEFSGKKVSGGAAGSFESELEKGTLKIMVHQTIYTDAPAETSENDLEIF